MKIKFKTGGGRNQKMSGQAATELAVFGAILIFLVGTILRTAIGSSYTQDYNFKAMRMAMLASWKDTTINRGPGASAVTAHNSASVLFVEDRLSPDAGKYGDLDRIPFIAQGSGTFTYNLLYPLSNSTDIQASLPIMDVYINGVHFPFTTASYVINRTILPQPVCSYAAGSCSQNQCLRNQREWITGVLHESTLNSTQYASATPITDVNCQKQSSASQQRICQEQTNAYTIFSDLITSGMTIGNSGRGYNSANTASVNAGLTSPFQSTSQWQKFTALYMNHFPNDPNTRIYLNAILNLVQGIGQHAYKLFYNMVPNGSGEWSVNPPQCQNPISKDHALCKEQIVGGHPNTTGDLMFDLQRQGIYDHTLNPSFVPNSPSNLRSSIAWEWSATPWTSAAMIGLDKSNEQYPSYDIDGRLKPVTIYDIQQSSNGDPIVTYEDPDGGDIDAGWDVVTSCGPKPGLQSGSEIYTFTGNGTYLRIREGKMFNPESGQFVRSANKRDTVDLIQRIIQLSNNTGRFCTQGPSPAKCAGPDCANPNPIEVCADESQGPNPCFTTDNIAKICYDTSSNIIFVRSRLKDTRGNYWLTNASGQLKVQ